MVVLYNYYGVCVEYSSNASVNQLRHNARVVVRELGLLNDAYFDVGVTLAERHLLIELTSSEKPIMGEIAERLLIDKSTASRLIAKALKKGYITCTPDAKDRRRRYLELTEKGKKTLSEFEPIAFSQTKNALLTLTPKEIETVYNGVALYAKGLKNSRLKSQDTLASQPTEIEDLSELYAQLGDLGYCLRRFEDKDSKGLYEIFQEVVLAGSYFPYECDSFEEFQRQFVDSRSHIYVCDSPSQGVIGGFYIRPNYSGRSKHIANAAYMLKESFRNKGIGSLLVKASLHLAKELGFHAMQYNMVLSQNLIAVRLYQKIGFEIVGTIPKAVGNPDGSYQDGYILHRSLD